MTKYPAQLDTTITLPTVIDNSSSVNGAVFNRLRNAVLAIETELGIKPSASYGTVKSRLDTLETSIINIEGVQTGNDIGGTLEEPLVVGLYGNPLSNVNPDVDQVLVWNGIAWSPTDQKSVEDILPSPSNPSNIGETIFWDGSTYISGFYAQDDIIPPVSITLMPALNLVEVGQPVIHPNFTAIYSGPGLVTNATLKDNDNNVIQSLSTPNSFSSNFSFTKNIFDGYVDFTLTATQNTRFIKSDIQKIIWGQRSYWGLGSAGQTGAAWITSLSNSVITNSKNVNFTLTAGLGQKIYFAYRTGYGDAIFTIKNIQGDFTKVGTYLVTNTFGFAENYDLYESNSTNLGPVNVLVSDGLELLMVSSLAQAVVFGSPFNSTEINANVYGTSVLTQGPGVISHKVLKTVNTTSADWVDFYYDVITTSTNYSAENKHQIIIVNTSSGPKTINLPSGGLPPGMEIIIKDSGSAGTNTLTVDGSGGDIDGSSTYFINANRGYVRLVTDGSDWYIVGEG